MSGHRDYQRLVAAREEAVRVEDMQARWQWAQWLLDRVNLPPVGTHSSPYLSAYYAYCGA